MSIKFLTDENISRSLVSALRKKDCDVKDIKEEKLFGISDIEVINKAKEDERVILTQDKNFGNLLNYPLQSHCGFSCSTASWITCVTELGSCPHASRKSWKPPETFPLLNLNKGVLPSSSKMLPASIRVM